MEIREEMVLKIKNKSKLSHILNYAKIINCMYFFALINPIYIIYIVYYVNCD